MVIPKQHSITHLSFPLWWTTVWKQKRTLCVWSILVPEKRCLSHVKDQTKCATEVMLFFFTDLLIISKAYVSVYISQSIVCAVSCKWCVVCSVFFIVYFIKLLHCEKNADSTTVVYCTKKRDCLCAFVFTVI